MRECKRPEMTDKMHKKYAYQKENWVTVRYIHVLRMDFTDRVRQAPRITDDKFRVQYIS